MKTRVVTYDVLHKLAHNTLSNNKFFSNETLIAATCNVAQKPFASIKFFHIAKPLRSRKVGTQ